MGPDLSHPWSPLIVPVNVVWQTMLQTCLQRLCLTRVSPGPQCSLLSLSLFLYACVLSCFICVLLFLTPWTVAHQVPLSTGFSRQDCWSRLPCPPPGDLTNPESEATSLTSPALAGGFFTTSTAWLLIIYSRQSSVVLTSYEDFSLSWILCTDNLIYYVFQVFLRKLFIYLFGYARS